ncbi:hypothetical protein BDV28DRAFT_144509 [Aspergillus coremiiformis]|uniref:HNH nuclease domain-containing protein n=1 Tax=Aspergillus coremiiformis TaxID=138285 RepID=A0A5N6YUE0_9EURO|nr:hypothetical protein BDV28DRAFT_144509 [Aspergillus coremiiformis]
MPLSNDQRVALQRPAFGEPTLHIASPLAFDPEYDICFRHPGYRYPYNILLILPGLDHPNGGIYHQAALWACGIITNNEFQGWFTEDQEGHMRATTPLNGILTRRNYYFQVPGQHAGPHVIDPYPIVPSFEDWSFPHEQLPAAWKFDIPREAPHPTPRQSTLAEVVLSRDVRCRLTNHIEGTECAHLIPRNQSIWFQRNMMSQYGRLPRPGCDPVDNPRNVILLRSDIHSAFDYKRFAFIPKPEHAAVHSTESTADQLPLAYVTHIFNSPAPHELTALYHNVSLQHISGIAPEYLFARFAWTLFQHINIFLQAGVPRRLALYDAFAGSAEAGSDIMLSLKTCSAEQCRLMPLRSKSNSRKRKQDDAHFEDDGSVPRGRTRRCRADPLAASLVSSVGSNTTIDGSWNPVCSGGQSRDTDSSDVDVYDTDAS